MFGLFKRTLLRIGATGVLVLLCAAVHAVVVPPAAQARCNGHTEVRSNLISAGQITAQEWPKWGTCNSNNNYTAYFRTGFGGWRAIVWYRTDTSSTVWRGFSCPGGMTCEYSFGDNDYYADIHLCIDNSPSGGNDYVCGWGERQYFDLTHAAYGQTWGF